MREVEHPGQRDDEAAGDGGEQRDGVEPFARRRARTPRRARIAGMPSAVAQRMRMLERRVEEALASNGVGAAAHGDVGRTILEEALTTVARVRRASWRDAAIVLRLFDRDVAPLLRLLYRYWWRVEAVGLDRVPASGPVIVVANRGPGLVPYEPLMVREALAHGRNAREDVRPLLDSWLFEVPVLGRAAVRAGTAAASAAVLRRRLGRSEAVVVQPEGGYAFAKAFRARYRLGRFTDGFARVAIELGTPIVPVAVIGSEEGQPVLARVDSVGRLLGLPTLPITPTLLPLPTKWRLHFGDVLDVSASYPPGRSRGEGAGRLREQVRERLQGLILEGLRRRRSVFLG
jgi:1-acyl-sn-glycerol-3-phosphate acyltransferase